MASDLTQLLKSNLRKTFPHAKTQPALHNAVAAVFLHATGEGQALP
jgi:hypothetical protein